MTFTNIDWDCHHFIASKPSHGCGRCSQEHQDQEAILRNQFLRLRISRQTCGDQLVDGAARERPSPYKSYEALALRGQKLLDDEAEHGTRSWVSAAGIARLPLMLRLPESLFHPGKLWLFRILGAVIPELDDVCSDELPRPPSPCYPVLPLHLRLVWLAGIAIVEQAGPAMLDLLQHHVMGDHQ
jgi:hypothetical protein